MAEKPEELETPEDKIARAKEMYCRGSRNYYVQAYQEAVDDLSEACSILAEHCGATADDCAMPYLIYAKTLIALAKDQNKVVDIPDEEDEDGDGAPEGGEEEGDEDEDGSEEPENDEAEKAENAEEKTSENGDEQTCENGTANEEKNGDVNSDDAQAGPSNAEEEEDSGLQIAWEVLELAAIIFSRQGEGSLANLADALIELGGISMENSHFDVAVKDFLKSLDVFDKMKDPSKRHIAEVHFKIGLSYSFLNEFESSVVALKKAIELLDMEIETLKAKEQTEELAKDIKDIEEIKQEIQDKITEVEEQKQESIEEVKRKLHSVLSHDANAEDSDGPGPSKANKPKPTDISHLIKRKKPEDATAEIEGSPAKRPALASIAEEKPTNGQSS